jgi:uncharacterized protein (AIM24 family)
MEEDAWILENGVYWASEGSIHLTVQREKMWTSFWAGERLIDWQTKLTGHGKAVLATPGPVDSLGLEKGQQVVANGKYVLARTAGVAYRIQRTTKSLIGTYIAGEGYCRFYEGPGCLLMSATPYWRYRLFAQRGMQPSQVAAVE